MLLSNPNLYITLMPMNFLRITYDIDIWVLHSSHGDLLARHGDLNSLIKCAIYFAKETDALLKIMDKNSINEKVYTHQEYRQIVI